MPVKNILKLILPPVIWRVLSTLYSRFRSKPQETLPPLEYVPEGWQYQARNPEVTGWNVESVAAAQQATWTTLRSALEGSKPLGIAPEAAQITNHNFVFHNTIMCYAYVLARTARNKDSISILDWGGGLGQYFLIAKALLPEVEIRYFCKELPILAQQGRQLLPEVTFYEDDRYLKQRYDLVMASGALQYVDDWQATLAELASVTGQYLYVTRLPVVQQTSSFVVVQRPYKMGYDTEYLSWHINRDEWMSAVQNANLELVREFLIAEQLTVYRAPENAQMRGFLLRPLASTQKVNS